MASRVRTSEEEKQKRDEDEMTKRKLWIGNIDKRLTEYQLIQMLKKFGEIEKFEYLFHMHGPYKGEPRGYCFVEFTAKEDSVKAMSALNGKKILSKCLIVDWAKQPTEDLDVARRKPDKRKLQQKPKVELSREKKIKMLEARLLALENSLSSSSGGVLDDVADSNLNTMGGTRRDSSKPFKEKPKI